MFFFVGDPADVKGQISVLREVVAYPAARVTQGGFGPSTNAAVALFAPRCATPYTTQNHGAA